MENILNLINLLNKTSNNKDNTIENPIPKEILDQYPYGEFPIRYTRPGQENIRKLSENRFKNDPIPPQNESKQEKKEDNLNLSSLMPFLQLLTSKNNNPKDTFKALSKILYKDNPQLQTLFELFDNTKNIKSQEINNTDNFPNTQKVNISSLMKIN